MTPIRIPLMNGRTIARRPRYVRGPFAAVRYRAAWRVAHVPTGALVETRAPLADRAGCVAEIARLLRIPIPWWDGSREGIAEAYRVWRAESALGAIHG